MILNHRIGRTMKEHRSQYISSFAMIVISCLLFTMLNLLSSNMQKMTESLEKNYVQENANFIANSQISDIHELEGKYHALIEENASFDCALSEGQTLRVFRENTKVNLPAVTEGKSLGSNAILIDPAFAKANGLSIGDDIQILNKSFVLCGFMSLPNYIYPLKSEDDITTTPAQFGVAVLGTEDFAQFSSQSQSFYSVKFLASDQSIKEQASLMRQGLSRDKVQVRQWTNVTDNKRVTFVTSKIQGMRDISSALPLAVLILTCILTGIVVTRLLNRESAVIGTLYALGYKRREISKHYIWYSLSIAIAGGIVGTVLGALLLKPMLDFMVMYFNIPVAELHFDAGIVVVSLLMPVLFLGVSSFFVLQRTLRYSPMQLMRGANTKSNVNPLEKKLKLARLNFAMKFRVREQVRSLSRLAFLLMGVALATMLLLLGFTAVSSLNSLLKNSIPDTLRYQYEYVYNAMQKESLLYDAEPFSVANFEQKTNDEVSFEICGINPDSKYIFLKGKNGKPLDRSKVILTKPLANRLHAKPGDVLHVVNQMDRREYSVTVDDVAEAYIGNMIFMPRDQFNAMLSLPQESFVGLWSTDPLDIPGQMLYRVSKFDDSMKQFEATMQPLQATIGAISLLSFIIGLIVIYVVTSMIIEENKETISLMKIFGYRNREVSSLVLDSSSLVVVIGYLLGIPLILASMSAMFLSLTQKLGLTLPVTLRYPYIIVGFAVVYLTYELSKLLSKKKLNRISMSEALKSGMD